MTRDTHPDRQPPADTTDAPRGQQTGKRSSDARNDPVEQDGARSGQPRRREADDLPADLTR
ncbi:hypothetical protein [Xanthomonas sp. XNM01]|uniref:hypothetical protein n=1 Tax=Xanthomonas sp. XNM01 TaxID=2769289 RepID=UPI00177F35DA|nr:hypothetical protein [Xanthomonas sp. XNM01]MBD9370700.1 hypothetical protein [Xanthomonas sp. XNM01]